MMHDDQPPIPVSGGKYGTTESTTLLHITGGHRAVLDDRGQWIWLNVATDAQPLLNPLPISRIDALAKEIGAELFGGDQVSGFETKLISRAWTPLDGPHDGTLQPAVLWAAIGGNAERAGAETYARLARNISFSLHAAGIRLRDASDHYRDQLVAAMEQHQPGERFANVQMLDLQLAFHSVLSELASARDYLAAIFASKVGAPPSIDALSRLDKWLEPASRAGLRKEPIIREMFAAYEPDNGDPWLRQLTEYRNQFLHRNPFGAANGARWLRYDVREAHGIQFPVIELPLGREDSSAPGQDALLRFVQLYRKMTSLLGAAVAQAAFPATLPHFVAS